MSRITFTNKKSLFFKALKSKVDTYFQENQLRKTGNRNLYIKSSIQVFSATLLYICLILVTPAWPLAIILCLILGINLAVIGFNIMHEGGHQSFSNHGWLNQTAAYTLNALGGSTYYWKIKHNINHHTYTNIEGLDSDIDVKPFMRLHQQQSLRWFHRYQHVYWVLLYGISYAVWIFYHDFEKFFTKKIAVGYNQGSLSRKEQLIFWITKISYVIVYLVLPILLVGPVKALIGYALVAFSCGLFISVVFQLAHIVEGTHFPTPNPDSDQMVEEWAVHQVRTTANFATRNKIAYWLLGGLNFQVEHHLFPRISHVHYPKINQFVKETCYEFNVPYLEYPSMWKAFCSHLNHIRKLGIHIKDRVTLKESSRQPIRF